jgi:periplasmic divalent cation tolerance protein
MTDKIVVLSSCGSADEAQKVARHLVETRLAACVSVLPGATSIYHWQGKVEEAPEWVLLIKTSRANFEALSAALAKIHSYQVPEIVAVQIVDGSPMYLEWLSREVREDHQ